MSRKHSALRCRLDGKERCLVGFEGEFDGVVLAEHGRLLVFPDTARLFLAVQERGWELADREPGFVDLDAVARWVAAPAAAAVDCNGFLDAWNLMLDLRSTVAGRNILGSSDEDQDLYDKLFYGNNLPAVTPPGGHFSPTWSAAEVARLAAVLRTGMEELRARLPKT